MWAGMLPDDENDIFVKDFAKAIRAAKAVSSTLAGFRSCQARLVRADKQDGYRHALPTTWRYRSKA